MQLTEVKIRNSRAVINDRLELPDGNGLTLRVSSDGRKAWSVIYRVAGAGRYDPGLSRNRAGDKKRMNIGYWPEVSLAQARAAASAIRAQALGGDDPRPTNVSAPTNVAQLIEAYCDNIKVKTVIDKRRLLEARVKPVWGSREIQTLGRSELIALVQPLSPSRQFEVRKHVVAMFNWAADCGLITVNPFVGVRIKIDMRPRDRVLTLPEAKRAYAAADEMGYPFGSLYQLLLLSGCRLRELAECKWNWIGADEIVIPGEYRKTGKPHIVPLTLGLRAILSRISKQHGDYIFSTTDGIRPISGFSKAKSQLDRLLGDEFAKFVIHDFRRTIRSHMSRLGIDAITAELILGHQLSGVMGIYDRYERLTERRAALDSWAHELAVQHYGSRSPGIS
jgi:integrase